ncbi:hypothetical protein D3C78_1414870 [compost metagenome]
MLHRCSRAKRWKDFGVTGNQVDFPAQCHRADIEVQRRGRRVHGKAAGIGKLPGADRFHRDAMSTQGHRQGSIPGVPHGSHYVFGLIVIVDLNLMVGRDTPLKAHGRIGGAPAILQLATGIPDGRDCRGDMSRHGEGPGRRR